MLKITVHNPDNLPTVDYRELQDFQGELKDLDEKSYNKLLRVLTKKGFRVPFYYWTDPDDGLKYTLDGHQRQRVFRREEVQNEKGGYEFPAISIYAKDRREAKEQLLEISSQYGKITQEGYDAFAYDLDGYDDSQFDALPDYSIPSTSDDIAKPDPNATLQERFIVPPFSVFRYPSGLLVGTQACMVIARHQVGNRTWRQSVGNVGHHQP